MPPALALYPGRGPGVGFFDPGAPFYSRRRGPAVCPAWPLPAGSWWQHPAQRRQTRLHLLVFGALALALAGLHFLWQYRVTGDPFLNPYTLWWEYDKIGFGPGVGVTEDGHSLHIARINTRFSLRPAGATCSAGRAIPGFSAFRPAGLLEKARGLLVGSVFPSLVFIHIFYWIGSELLARAITTRGCSA
jgi:hypothetical protein